MFGSRFRRKLGKVAGATSLSPPISKAKAPRTRNAKRSTGPEGLLWQIWSRFADLDDLMPLCDKWTVSRTAELFDNFVIANDDLFREVESEFRTSNGVPLEILTEVERRAQHSR
jgi:hypothetical protein